MGAIPINISEHVGNTPMVRLTRLVPGAPDVELYGKLEAFNPGGSVKDRIGVAMIEAAEVEGRIEPGRTMIVEATSGNTGIALAFCCAAKGYDLTIFLPQGMSREREALLRLYGARVQMVESLGGMNEAVDAARAMARDRDVFLPDQFSNPANPEAHRTGTGPEILRALDGRVDVFVAGIGTGGTITGVGQALKDNDPGTLVVGVEPASSAVLSGGRPGPHRIQGIGAGFVPQVLDVDVVDEVLACPDEDAIEYAHELAAREGILAGMSCGAAVWAALEVARRPESRGKRIVTVLPDSVRNYMTKFMDEAWMRENGFTERVWETGSVAEMLRSMPRRELFTAASSDTVADSVLLMKERGVSQLPVLENERLVGIVTESDLLGKLVEGRASLSSSVAEVMFRKVRTVHESDDAGSLTKLFAEGLVALVVGDEQELKGIVTKMDLVDYLTRGVDKK
jgi:cysteine synthase A